MIHRAIIEIQITKSENDDRFEKIKAEGMDKKFIEIMRQIYSAIESAFDKKYVKHIQIGAIFGRGGGYDYGEFEERASEELSESEELEIFKTIFFKYYVEVEIKEKSNERIDFDYIIDLFIDDIHEDDLKIGYLSPREADFDMFVEGVYNDNLSL